MPIKQVMCCQCNSLVNKAQTYSIGKDQRACAKHEGVTAKKDELEAARLQKIQKDTAKGKPKKFDAPPKGAPVSAPKGSAWATDPSIPMCWLCANKGLRQQEFFMKLLVEREKARLIHGEINPFDPNHPGNKINIGRCIFLVPLDKCNQARPFLREDFEPILQMAKCIAICGPCCGTLKIDPLPKPEYKDLVQFSMLGTIMQPVIEKIAKAEMAKAN